MQCPKVKTLSYIVGGLNVFFSALLTVRVFVELCVYSHEEYESKDNNFIEQAFFRWGLDTLITSLFVGAVWLAFSICLMKGIYQDNYKWMSCWIYMNYIILAVIFGGAGIAFISDLYNWKSFGTVIVNLLLYIIICALAFGFFYPVFSFYQCLQLPPMPSEHQPLKSGVRPGGLSGPDGPVTGMSFDVRGDEF